MNTVYLKIDKNVKVDRRSFCLKELGEVTCEEKALETKLKLLKIPSAAVQGPGRYVFSISEVIDAISQEYPSVQISNLGEADFIVTLERKNPPPLFWQWAKTAAVCILCFFGAAFSIMSFNNDIGITRLFGQLYQQFTGKASNGFTVLEVSYSIGVGLGILIFFNHFAKKRGSSDPTPLETEMRKYEDDIDKTIIEGKSRKAGQKQS